MSGIFWFLMDVGVVLVSLLLAVAWIFLGELQKKIDAANRVYSGYMNACDDAVSLQAAMLRERKGKNEG